MHTWLQPGGYIEAYVSHKTAIRRIVASRSSQLLGRLGEVIAYQLSLPAQHERNLALGRGIKTLLRACKCGVTHAMGDVTIEFLY